MDLIRKKGQIKLPEKVKGIIYGEPGVGKSTLALSMPTPVLLFDFDEGIHRVQAEYRTDTVQVKNLQEFKEVLNTYDLSEYNSFVIDGFGKYIERIYNEMLKRGKKSQQTWGNTLDEFKQLNLLLNDMPQHLCYVAHQKLRKTNDSESDKFGVDGSGSSKDCLIGEMDFVGYMEMLGRNRSITFSPSDRFYAKNSAGLDDYIEIPILKTGDTNDFLTREIIIPTIERRKQESVENQKNEEQLQQGRELIEQGTDPNAVMTAFKEMKLSKYNKVKLFKELQEKFKDMTFNKKSGIFEKIKE